MDLWLWLHIHFLLKIYCGVYKQKNENWLAVYIIIAIIESDFWTTVYIQIIHAWRSISYAEQYYKSQYLINIIQCIQCISPNFITFWSKPWFSTCRKKSYRPAWFSNTFSSTSKRGRNLESVQDEKLAFGFFLQCKPGRKPNFEQGRSHGILTSLP